METTTKTAPDLRGLPKVFGDVSYAAMLSCDGVPPEDFRAIAAIPCFSRTTLQADDEKDFERLGLYARDAQFYWGVDVESL